MPECAKLCNECAALLVQVAPVSREHRKMVTGTVEKFIGDAVMAAVRLSVLRVAQGRNRAQAIRHASPFLITPEVATRLRCSVRTVHELTRQGLIPTAGSLDLDDVYSAKTNSRPGSMAHPWRRSDSNVAANSYGRLHSEGSDRPTAKETYAAATRRDAWDS